jgi:ABC-type nitrate/sulfonate/bicarbonate transport system substrate-binding protein
MIRKVILLLLSSSLILSACAPTSTPTAVPTITPTQPTEVTPVVVEPTATLQLVHLKVAQFPYMTEAPYFIAQDEGFFAEQGLEVEFVPFAKSSDIIPALVQGQLDVSTVFIGAGFLNAIAGGANTKIVAGKGYLDGTACGYTGWMAPAQIADSGTLNDIKNWAGKKIATEKGTTSEYALEVLLAQGGLTLNDVEIMDVPIFNRMESLKNGAIDIAGSGEPWVYRMESSGTAKMIKSFNSYLPDLQWGVIAYGPTLLEGNPGVGIRFMKAFIKGLQQYNLGKTDRNVEIIAKYTELTPDEVRQTCWQTMRADA